MCVWEPYLKGQSQIQLATPSLTPTVQQIWPADPLRFCFVISANVGSALFVSLGYGSPQLNPEFLVGTGISPLILTADLLGDLITFPIWCRSNAAGPFVQRTYTVSYLPERYRAYERYCEQQLSKAGAFRPFD